MLLIFLTIAGSKIKHKNVKYKGAFTLIDYDKVNKNVIGMRYSNLIVTV